MTKPKQTKKRPLKLSPDIWVISGINGQHVMVHVPAQTVVVKLSTWPVATSQRLGQLTVDGALAIAAALAG